MLPKQLPLLLSVAMAALTLGHMLPEADEPARLLDVWSFSIKDCEGSDSCVSRLLRGVLGVYWLRCQCCRSSTYTATPRAQASSTISEPSTTMSATQWGRLGCEEADRCGPSTQMKEELTVVTLTLPTAAAGWQI